MVNERKSATGTLHPQGPFLQKWNRIFVISCILAVSVDPLFLYIPVISDEKPCWYLDRKLEKAASVLRFFTDIFYILHIIFQFRTGFLASSPTTFGRGVLIEDRYAITKRYLSTYFFIDVFAILPIPQVIILVVLPILQDSDVMKAKSVLMIIIICQYVPRLIRIRPLYLQITRSAGVITETARAGAAFNLLLTCLPVMSLEQFGTYFLSNAKIPAGDMSVETIQHVLQMLHLYTVGLFIRMRPMLF
jgi:cyclic nucleotide gated channel